MVHGSWANLRTRTFSPLWNGQPSGYINLVEMHGNLQPPESVKASQSTSLTTSSTAEVQLSPSRYRTWSPTWYPHWATFLRFSESQRRRFVPVKRKRTFTNSLEMASTSLQIQFSRSSRWRTCSPTTKSQVVLTSAHRLREADTSFAFCALLGKLSAHSSLEVSKSSKHMSSSSSDFDKCSWPVLFTQITFFLSSTENSCQAG
mmetsp:Transcript_27368/g.63757  ORF Transcript_27368/g.63757 Transcript_27368/m.63757 type:complete len:203 (-) Transcript_27368:406-1014(-)